MGLWVFELVFLDFCFCFLKRRCGVGCMVRLGRAGERDVSVHKARKKEKEISTGFVLAKQCIELNTDCIL